MGSTSCIVRSDMLAVAFTFASASTIPSVPLFILSIIDLRLRILKRKVQIEESHFKGDLFLQSVDMISKHLISTIHTLKEMFYLKISIIEICNIIHLEKGGKNGFIKYKMMFWPIVLGRHFDPPS